MKKPKYNKDKKLAFLIKRLWRDNAHRARKYDISFTLTLDEYSDLISRNCYYCNSKPKNHINSHNKDTTLYYSGLDRVDNTKGYDLTNVVPCCKTCNGAKSNLTTDEFYNMCTKVTAKVILENKPLTKTIQQTSLDVNAPTQADTINQEQESK